MNRKEKRNRQKILNRVNKHYSDQFVQIQKDEWPILPKEHAERLYVFRNNRFLVQVFREKTSIRISVNRTELTGKGQWNGDISWDDLQWIKKQIGYGDYMAVEVYPREIDVMNVANMRHLWLVGNDTDIGWKR